MIYGSPRYSEKFFVGFFRVSLFNNMFNMMCSEKFHRKFGIYCSHILTKIT